MATGYIKLFRSSMNDPLYFKEPFTKWQAWCDLIQLAYYAPSEFFVRGIRVKTKRGCVYKGVLELAERWKWSRGKVERFLLYLELDKRISVQKSKVISCISITNYDKYQQNESTNRSTNESTNRSTNEHLIRIYKEDKEENIKAVSPKGDDGLGIEAMVSLEEPMVVLQKLVEQMSELKERLDEQDRLSSNRKKKKPVNPLITKGRELFERRYSDLFEGGAYYWQAKDAVAMDALTKKIIYSRQQKGMSVEDDEVLKGLTAFLNSISDPWLLKNFSVTSINGKYNEIVAQAKATKKQNGSIKTDKRRSSEVTATEAKDYEGTF